MSFTSFLDPVLGPVLYWNPLLAIFILSFGITALITIVYKFTTDQKHMKKLKGDLKDHQKKIKELGKTNPEKALKVQQEAMSLNMEYMKHSFKSTLYTMIPVLIIFAWLSSNLAYHPIEPDTEFTITAYFAEGHAPSIALSAIPDLQLLGNATQQITTIGKQGMAQWALKGAAGEYKMIYDYNNEKYEQMLLITDKRKYEQPEKLYKDSKLKKTVIGNEKVYPFGESLKISWFWTYFIFSIGISMGLRKLLKVY